MENCSNIHSESAKVLLHLKVTEIQIQKEKTLKEHREELVPKLSVGFANMIFWGEHTDCNLLILRNDKVLNLH